MLRNLTDIIRKLNADTADVANCEKAKKLKKTLVTAGAIATVVGAIGVFTCFVLFATAGFAAFDDNGFTARILVPFFLFVPFGFVLSAGIYVLNLGLRIVIGGAVSKFVDNSINVKCPNCGDVVTEGELYCSKCGTKIVNKCPNCGAENSFEDKFCKKCGEKLD